MMAYKVEPKKLFRFFGKVYQWKLDKYGEKTLCDENGNKIPPQHIPFGLYVGHGEVEIVGESEE